METQMDDDASGPGQVHAVLGTGPLGRATATALRKAGHSVVLVNRSGKMIDAPDGVCVVAGDLGRPAALVTALEGAVALHFCVQPPYHLWPREFPVLQVYAVQLAVDLGARLVVAENLDGYGVVDGPITEDLPLTAMTRTGRVRAVMHETLMRTHAKGRVDVAVARSSDFFGPYVEGSAVGARAFKAVVSGGSVEYFGDLDTLHSYTFVENFGTAMATLGSDIRSSGAVWHVPNGPAVSSRAFFDMAFGFSDKKPRYRKLGEFEMRASGLFVPALREMIEMTYEFERPFVVDDSRFKAVFGDTSTPLPDALRRTVAWTQDHRDRP